MAARPRVLGCAAAAASLLSCALSLARVDVVALAGGLRPLSLFGLLLCSRFSCHSLQMAAGLYNSSCKVCCAQPPLYVITKREVYEFLAQVMFLRKYTVTLLV